jgi:hypothetical protein
MSKEAKWFIGFLIGVFLAIGVFAYFFPPLKAPQSLSMIQEVLVDLEAKQEALEGRLETVQREVTRTRDEVKDEVAAIDDTELSNSLNLELQEWRRGVDY